jgi:16S rRNA (uracil1498-N3)-methyltransferase
LRTHTVWIDQKFSKTGDIISLNSREDHHLKNVLRVNSNTEIICLNGQGETIKARTILNDRVLKVELIEGVKHQKPNEIHLYGPLPKGKRIEQMFEKLQEIGVSSFTPIKTKYSQQSSLNAKEINKVNQKIIDACKQSLCPWLLQIKDPISFSKIIDLKNLFILNATGEFISNINIDKKNINLAFGPEGGWSEEEVNFIKENNFPQVKCSEYILRMETAAITGANRMIEKLANN